MQDRWVAAWNGTLWGWSQAYSKPQFKAAKRSSRSAEKTESKYIAPGTETPLRAYGAPGPAQHHPKYAVNRDLFNDDGIPSTGGSEQSDNPWVRLSSPLLAAEYLVSGKARGCISGGDAVPIQCTGQCPSSCSCICQAWQGILLT